MKYFFICLLLSSCISTRYIDLKEKHTETPVVAIKVTKDEALSKVRQFVTEQGYKIATNIISADVVTFTVNNTLWRWENESNPSALLVIRKMKDVGGNRIKKPSEVRSTWEVQVTDGKMVVRLVSAEVIYKAPSYLVDTSPGATTQQLEKMITEAVNS